MGWVIFSIILLVVAVAARLFGKWCVKKAPSQGIDEASVRRIGVGFKFGALGAVFLMLLLTGCNSVKIVPAGYVGVKYEFGEIIGQTDDGLQVIAPWQDLRTASTRTQKKHFENLTAFSKETQDVFVNATLNLSVSPDTVQRLYRTVGPDWYEKLVPPRVNQTLKDETVKFSTVEVAPNREAIRKAVRERLAEQLKQYSINVEDFLLDDVDFRPEFKQAIERKQIATQDAQTAYNRIKEAENKAQQAIKTAEGEGQAILVKAQKQAEANQRLASSLSPLIVTYEYVQKLAKNISVMLLPQGGNYILPQSLLGSATTSGK